MASENITNDFLVFGIKDGPCREDLLLAAAIHAKGGKKTVTFTLEDDEDNSQVVTAKVTNIEPAEDCDDYLVEVRTRITMQGGQRFKTEMDGHYDPYKRIGRLTLWYEENIPTLEPLPDNE